MDVLIVDDDAAIRSLMVEVLEDEGWIAHTAADADAAWRQLQWLRPNVVMLDQRLPGMDGLDLWQRLHTAPHTQDIPVILMSALPDRPQTAADAPAAYLAKPFTLAALLAVLRRVVPPR